jgi:hypothetical protein
MAGHFSCSSPEEQIFEKLLCPQCKSPAHNWYQELRRSTKYQVSSPDVFWEEARLRKGSSGIPIGKAYWRDMFSMNESQNWSVEWLFVSSDKRGMGCMRALFLFGKKLIKYDPVTREACELYYKDKVSQILTGMTLLVNVLIPKEATFYCSSCSMEKGVRQRYVHMLCPPCVTFRPPRPAGPGSPVTLYQPRFHPRVEIASDIEMRHDQYVDPNAPPSKILRTTVLQSLCGQ